MESQLTLDFPAPQRLSRIHILRDGERLRTFSPSPPAEAHNWRERLITQLKNSPITEIQWEDDPRPTGWFGVKNTPYVGTTVYEIIVKPEEQA